MNERIPVLYDMRLRPEWIDFALEQYLKCGDEDTHRTVLREYLSTQIKSEAAVKTASQLQRNVGYRSPLSRDRLESLYTRMCTLSPEDRLAVRLQILVESTPFFADCVAVLRKLYLLGVNGISMRQLEERVVAKYGERETVTRRVRYVLQTLALLGAVENKDKKWFVRNLPET